jgi:membrane protein required for colicin V production
MVPMLDQLIWVDYAILGILVLSVLISVWRGFLREALSLATWVAAFFVAVSFADTVALRLSDFISVPSVRLAAGFLLLLLATLILGGLVGFLLSRLLEGTGLDGTDRVLGVVFGVMRGVVVVVILILLAALTPLPEDPWWQQSALLPRFIELADMVRDLLPPSYAEYFQLGQEPGATRAAP